MQNHPSIFIHLSLLIFLFAGHVVNGQKDIVAQNSSGALYKIDRGDAGRVSLIETRNFFPGADGLLRDKNEDPLVAQNKSVNKIYCLSSKDNRRSAKIKATTSI